tara:strand:- start:15410 stop:16873 length:1464 start_codon:yes stop_codon:yes gene_type:complete
MSYSQASSLLLGEPYVGKNDHEVNVLEEYFTKGTEMLAVRKTDENEVIIQKMDLKTLKLTSTKKYEDMPANFYSESAVEFNGHYFLFYSFWDAAKKEEVLFYYEIDFSKGTFIGEAQKLLTTNKAKPSKMYQDMVSKKYGFFISEDNKKLMIKSRSKPPGNNDEIRIHVFNSELEEEWNRKVEMPYPARKIEYVDFMVSNTSDVNLVIKVYERGKHSTFHKELVHIGSQGNVLATKIDLGDKFVRDVDIASKEGKPFGIGFYSMRYRDKEEKTIGIFKFEIAEDGSISHLITKDFPEEKLVRYIKEGKKDISLGKLKVRNIDSQGDEGIVITAEHRFTIGSEPPYIDCYYDILILKLDNDANIKWINRLAKRQESRSSNSHTSFAYKISEGFHYMFYLDHSDNKNRGLDEKPVTYGDTWNNYQNIVSVFKVNDKTGEVAKNYLFDLREIEGQVFPFKPQEIKQLDDGSYVIEVDNRERKKRLLKVRY